MTSAESRAGGRKTPSLQAERLPTRGKGAVFHWRGLGGPKTGGIVAFSRLGSGDWTLQVWAPCPSRGSRGRWGSGTHPSPVPRSGCRRRRLPHQPSPPQWSRLSCAGPTQAAVPEPTRPRGDTDRALSPVWGQSGEGSAGLEFAWRKLGEPLGSCPWLRGQEERARPGPPRRCEGSAHRWGEGKATLIIHGGREEGPARSPRILPPPSVGRSKPPPAQGRPGSGGGVRGGSFTLPRGPRRRAGSGPGPAPRTG